MRGRGRGAIAEAKARMRERKSGRPTWERSSGTWDGFLVGGAGGRVRCGPLDAARRGRHRLLPHVSARVLVDRPDTRCGDRILPLGLSDFALVLGRLKGLRFASAALRAAPSAPLTRPPTREREACADRGKRERKAGHHVAYLSRDARVVESGSSVDCPDRTARSRAGEAASVLEFGGHLEHWRGHVLSWRASHERLRRGAARDG